VGSATWIKWRHSVLSKIIFGSNSLTSKSFRMEKHFFIRKKKKKLWFETWRVKSYMVEWICPQNGNKHIIMHGIDYNRSWPNNSTVVVCTDSSNWNNQPFFTPFNKHSLIFKGFTLLIKLSVVRCTTFSYHLNKEIHQILAISNRYLFTPKV
jgi:hypothetical protein